MRPRSCADSLLRCFAQQGARHLFLVPGAHIDPLLISLGRQELVRGVACSHELGAAFMADGYARMREGIGTCAAIGGPGAANMVAGAYTANRHNVSVIYLTGNTPTQCRNRGAFQSSDGSAPRLNGGLIGTAAGASYSLRSPGMLKSIWPAMLRRLHGRPAGPVHLEVPFDVLAGPSGAPSYSTKRTHPSRLSPSALAQLRGLTGRLARLTRVAMLVGPELNSARGAKELRAFSRQFCLPVATTADVPGLFLEPHARHLGSFGYGGCSRAASVLLDETLEGLIVVGAGLDERNTLRWLPHLFRPGMALMLIRPVPLGPPDDCVRLTYVQADCADALRQLREWKRGSTRDFAATANARVKWVDSLHAVSIEPPLPPDATDAEGVHPAVLVQNMRRCLPDNAVLFVDSGLHRLFAYHYWSPRHRLGLITAARTAPTGWAICAAIGASLAGAPGPVVVLTGDGCMLMHGNELATAARYHAPVIFVVSSNSVNGNVVRRLRQVSPIAAELGSLPAVDWVAFARALGVPGCRARTRAEVQEALEAALAHTGPYVVEVMTPAECGVPIPEHAVSCCNVEFIRRMKPRKSPRQSASHAPRPSRR